MKQGRHQKILELIVAKPIETQEDLIVELNKEGFEVTQATISRDIREMKLSKITTPDGKYRYVLPAENKNKTINVKFNPSLVESITHVDSAMNIIVLKTYPGMAGAVAVGIDRLDLSQILGCVAGDDTIIVVTTDADSASTIGEKLKELIGKL